MSMGVPLSFSLFSSLLVPPLNEALYRDTRKSPRRKTKGILRAKLLNGNDATLRAALIRESRGGLRVFTALRRAMSAIIIRTCISD